FTFFILLSILGYSILFIIKKKFFRVKNDNKRDTHSLSFLEQLFISFGIGMAIYISLGYFLDLFKAFNFYTAYLSVIIFDITFLSYLIFKNRGKIKSEYKISLLRQRFNEYFSNKNNLICLGSLIFILIISILIQLVIINDSDSLIYTDPFKNYHLTFYLIDNGHIDYNLLDYNYPSGHIFFNAGVLLIYPDYIFGYYFFKLISIFFLSLYIVIAFVIFRKLFKKNYLVFLSLLFILISRYFVARTILYLSSSLASLILIISLIILVNKYPDYIIGIFLAALYLIHPLTAFYFIFVLVCFYIFKCIILIKSREDLFNQLISIIFLMFLSICFLIPYFLSIYFVYNDTLMDFLKHFVERFTNFEDALSYRFYKDIGNYFLVLIYPLEYFKPFVDEGLLDVFDEIFRNSIFLFFILSIFGLFIYVKPRKSNKDLENLALFKFFIIIIVFFFFLPYFFSNLDFFIKFRKRILQSFCLPVIIMAIYSIEWIINKAGKITEYFIYKFRFYNKIINAKKLYSKLLRIDSILVILLLISASSIYYMHRWPDYYYQYDDELVDVVLYLRDNAEEDSIILRQDFDSVIIFRMLYDMKIKEWDLNESSTYEELLLEVQQRNIDYLIFPKEFFNDGSIAFYIEHHPDFDEKLENDDYILYKI
ncbi:MAG: hypothetical protein ACFFAH_08465, partial [Promethearchaeota archaeon]